MGKKIYANEQAIPAWMKVKDTTLETLFKSRILLADYRTRKNPRDLKDLKNCIVTLYNCVRMDYIRDDKLIDRYPELKSLDALMFGFDDDTHDTSWWQSRYTDIDGIIFDLGITKITIEQTDPERAIFDGVNL